MGDRWLKRLTADSRFGLAYQTWPKSATNYKMVTLVANGAKPRRRAARPATAESRVQAQETSASAWDELVLHAERFGSDIAIASELADDLRARAKRLAAAVVRDGPQDAVQHGVLAHAAGIFAGVALQRAWSRADAQALFERVAFLTGTSPEQTSEGIYSRAVRDPRLLTLSPGQAIKAELGLLYAVAPVSEVSLWAARQAGPVHCLFSFGSVAPSRHARLRVSETLQDPSKRTGTPRSIHVLPISRTTGAEAALAIRVEPGGSSRALELAEEVVPVLGWILERRPALERSEEAQQALAESLERETRIACDLHDGSLQDVAALASDLRYFRRQLEQALPPSNGDPRLLGRVDDIEARIRQIDAGLRAVAQDGALPASTTESFSEALQEIAEDLRAVSGIRVMLEFDDTAELLCERKRSVAIRVVQEALHNVARHSGADEACVRVAATRSELKIEVSDNGRGFDVQKARRRAIRNGRLGLRSMEQRARLLGGTLELFSSGQGPTKVILTLGHGSGAGDATTISGRKV